jgi:hypothetical protein
MNRGVLAAAVAFVACAPASAATVTLDFEAGSYTLLQDDVLTDRYISNGILFDTSGTVANGFVTNTKIVDPNNPIAVFIFRFGSGMTVQSLDIKGGGAIRVGTDIDNLATILPTANFQTFTQFGGPGQIYLISNFEFSVDNAVISTGVPEPATWALMIAGFGMAGAATRRRISKAQLA